MTVYDSYSMMVLVNIVGSGRSIDGGIFGSLCVILELNLKKTVNLQKSSFYQTQDLIFLTFLLWTRRY